MKVMSEYGGLHKEWLDLGEFADTIQDFGGISYDATLIILV